MLKIFQGTYQDKQESVVGSTFKHEKPNAWLIFNPKMTQLIGYNMFTNELKKKKILTAIQCQRHNSQLGKPKYWVGFESQDDTTNEVKIYLLIWYHKITIHQLQGRANYTH